MFMNSIQQKFDFSDYQIAQLKYLWITTLSELSKFILLGIIFRNDFKIYLYSICLLCILRFSTGGFHCDTYLGCFFTTLTFLIISLKVLPLIVLPTYIILLFLIFCAIINLVIGPISSDKRLPQTQKTKKRLAYQSFFIILFHLFLNTIIMSPTIIVGSWIIILHTLQLILAKFQKIKRRVAYEKS